MKYVVEWAYKTSAPGLHGWHTVRREYPDLETAKAVFDGPAPVTRLIHVTLWHVEGRKWKNVERRKPERINRKIRTHYEPVGFPDCDWTAIDRNSYDGPGSPIGHGATEQEALADLLEQLEE